MPSISPSAAAARSAPSPSVTERKLGRSAGGTAVARAAIAIGEVAGNRAAAPPILTDVTLVRLLPVILTVAPVFPLVGVKLAIEGLMFMIVGPPCDAHGTTVKLVALVAVPALVVTV